VRYRIEVIRYGIASEPKRFEWNSPSASEKVQDNWSWSTASNNVVESDLITSELELSCPIGRIPSRSCLS
jgi:hypothetical protein